MTRDEINAFFPYNGTATDFGALNFAVPTRAWVLGPYSAFLKERLWDDNLSQWKFPWECRDFASLARILAVECWANTVGAQTTGEDGLAFGEFWFIPDPSKPNDGHAQCPVITEFGLDIYEPQTQLLCPATLARLPSVYYRRF